MVSKICFGFEVHQPYRVNEGFRTDGTRRIKDPDRLYFTSLNREVLERVAEYCYIPATQLVLEALDHGFKCAFSISGTVLEQLDRWSPDSLDLFCQVAAHPHCELLNQTYYHSLSSLFDDISEFEVQVRMHGECMKEIFGVKPEILENTEFIFDNRIAKTALDMGFNGIYTEGVGRVLGGKSPNQTYRCCGIPVLLRNCTLSDDIAFRFSWRDWDKWPLTAETYAEWIASSPGECAHIFVDFETFGEHQWQETGILDFLKWLPPALSDEEISCILPSQATALNSTGEIDCPGTISWADLEKDTSAWLGNNLQQSAFRAVQSLGRLRHRDAIWRYLQTSDHFYYLASKNGSCGEVHRYFCPQEALEAFDAYMNVLCDYFGRCTAFERSRVAAKTLRLVPPDLAFHFMEKGGYAGYSAHNLDEFIQGLRTVSERSILHHLGEEDFSHWVREVIGDSRLADAIEDCSDRQSVIETVERRTEALWNRLK